MTNLTTLQQADWAKLRQDVNDRIDALEQVTKSLQPGPLSDKIANDLIFPAIHRLGSFICLVSFDDLPEETPPNITRFQP